MLLYFPMGFLTVDCWGILVGCGKGLRSRSISLQHADDPRQSALLRDILAVFGAAAGAKLIDLTMDQRLQALLGYFTMSGKFLEGF